MSTTIDIERTFSCEFCLETFSTSYEKGKHLNICATKTNQCPTCKKYIVRSIFAYHSDNSCTNPDLLDQKIESTPSSRTQQLLNEKALQARRSLGNDYYEPELNHLKDKFQFNIVVMGSPRVGKSSLINAICGRDLAQTSPSLHPCTQDIKCYPLENDQQTDMNTHSLRMNIWDTPGIESWNDQRGTLTMIDFIEQTNPLCVIYCASPGSLVKLDQLKKTLDYCKTKNIFCALVCTNMWAGVNRNQVIEEFEKQLRDFGVKVHKLSEQPNYRKPHKVTFFGSGALCTMVNSKEYYDEEFSEQRMPIQGIDELIHAIMESLNDDKLLGWCYTVLNQRSYWEKVIQNVGGFFQLHLAYPCAIIASSYEQTVTNFARYFHENFQT